MTREAFEALLVVDPSFGEDLISMVDITATFGTALTLWGLDVIGLGVFHVTVGAIAGRKL